MQIMSPNFDSREGHAVDMLVLHYTGMMNASAACARLCDAASRVSAHYLVDEDGAVCRLVEEEHRAWHAGISYWRGNSNINQRSIGIEMVNPGHEFGYRPYTGAQLHSVKNLCADILARHAIAARNIVGHSDIAPTRKEDPGELFPWKSFAEHHIGLWPVGEGAGAAGAEALSAYGYDITDMPKAITAFQRHFRPADIQGRWDAECAAMLGQLLQQCRA